MLTQIPSHLAVEIIKVLEGGVGPPLTALPHSLHHLAVSAHLPCVSSEKTLHLDVHTFMSPPSPSVLDALLTAVSTTPLRNISVCCCCLKMLSVTTGVVDAFACMLRASPGLTSLDLRRSFCTESIAGVVTDALPALPHLRSLTLRPESLGIKRSHQLLASLAVHGTHVTKLSLHAFSCSTDHTINPFAPLAAATSSTPSTSSEQSITTCSQTAQAQRTAQRSTTALAATLLRLTSLESLTLTGDTLTGPILRDIEGALNDTSSHSMSSTLQFLPRLTHLAFRCVGLRNAASRALAPVLRRLHKLQELLLLWNPMEASTADALASAISSLPRLTVVNLRHSSLEDSGGRALANACSTLTALRHINISDCDLTPSTTATLMPMLAHFSHLEHLDISNCPLSGAGGTALSGVKALAVALQDHTTLKHLLMCNVDLNSEGAKLLAPCIARQAGLQSLYLQCNDKLGSAGVVELSRRLEALSCLETLRLDCTEVDTAAARAFGAALQRLTALRSLNLIGFRLLSSHTMAQVAFGVSFSKLECLEVLDLSWSNFSGPAAQGLSRSLRYMVKLQELHLQYNPMGDVGAISLAPALAKLQHLRKVNFIGAQLSDKGAKEIIKQLDGRSNLELCLLDVNDIGEMLDTRGWLSSQTDDV